MAFSFLKCALHKVRHTKCHESNKHSRCVTVELQLVNSHTNTTAPLFLHVLYFLDGTLYLQSTFWIISPDPFLLTVRIGNMPFTKQNVIAFVILFQLFIFFYLRESNWQPYIIKAVCLMLLVLVSGLRIFWSVFLLEVVEQIWCVCTHYSVQVLTHFTNHRCSIHIWSSVSKPLPYYGGSVFLSFFFLV